MVCIFKKPDGVCCEYDKQEHKALTFQNSEYGWDHMGCCMVGSTLIDDTGMCTLFEAEDE